MIAHLKGIVHAKGADHVVVDVNGVGYQIFISLNTLYELPPETMEVSLHIHTHVREEAWHLYGFLSPDEKKIFEQLLKVNGVGPKLAMTLLSRRTVYEITEAIVTQDANRLKSIPGIGQKTVERILLDLKDKISHLKFEKQSASLRQNGETVNEALSALIHLGYTGAQAQAALNKIDLKQNLPLKEMIRQGLKNLARN